MKNDGFYEYDKFFLINKSLIWNTQNVFASIFFVKVVVLEVITKVARPCNNGSDIFYVVHVSLINVNN